MKIPHFFIPAIVLSLVGFTSNAQVESAISTKIEAANTITKGTKIFGGSIDLPNIQIYPSGDFIGAGLSMGYGKFITNKLLLSGGLSVYQSQYISKSGNSSNFMYGAGTGLEYYFFVKDRTTGSIAKIPKVIYS